MSKGLLLLVMLVGLAAVFPVSAQDAATCPGDLTAVIESLNADYETPEDALRALITAREALQAAELNCARAGVVLVEEEYAPAEGTFTLNYPNGWEVGIFSPSETGGVLFLGNTPRAQDYLQVEQPTPEEGAVALQVLIGTPTDRQDVGGLQSVVADFELLLRGLYPDSSTTEFFTLDGREAARMSYRGTAFDGFLVALTMDNGRFVAIRGVTSTGNLDALQAIAQAVAVSTR
ncbi:MAG: hypothetical protein IPK17_16575 [Chloroflexi bacterium]|uniref:hypothetical protein n=1 Tax=Candidatus Flexifilum breve TaxID=3140694 RepID=UPI003136CD25|nr:hypothetical protein [Chloroflexota bacterium]